MSQDKKQLQLQLSQKALEKLQQLYKDGKLEQWLTESDDPTLWQDHQKMTDKLKFIYCPWCGEVLNPEKAKKPPKNEDKIKTLKEEWNERKTSPFKCTNCGFPVKKEDPACPICGNTKATRT
jgi:predicted RNA-binding Zn-ribbon protein involved in translation (DUF1610 family)